MNTSNEQKITTAITTVLPFIETEEWISWATAWLNDTDRTSLSAEYIGTLMSFVNPDSAAADIAYAAADINDDYLVNNALSLSKKEHKII